jgi:choline kinase
MDKSKILEKYFTYSNVEHIYECLPDKQNIDKCFEINLADMKSDSDVEIINGDIIFKQKYLKYKAKYLSLKNKIKTFK